MEGQAELKFSELDDGTRVKIDSSGFTIFGVVTRTGLRVTRVERKGMFRILSLDQGETVEIDRLVSGSHGSLGDAMLEDLRLFTKPP